MLKIGFLLLVATLGLTPVSWANQSPTSEQTPYQLIEGVTVGILNLIETHKELADSDPKPFYSELEILLNDVIDFNFIAKNVMGPYGKEASPQQRERFETVFKTDLVETYARGLLTYGNQEIILLPSDPNIEGKRRVTVYQEIRSENKAYPLNYSLGLNRKGQWKVTNLVINGINLGKTFRNQFLQRAKEFDGNIDNVIDNWSYDPQT